VSGGVCTYLHHSYVDKVASTLAHLLGGLQELTGWSFCVLIGGLTSETGGNIEMCSLHVGKTDLGYTFDQVNPDFTSNIIRPFRSFLDKVPGKPSVVGNGGPELTNLQCCAPSRMLTKPNGARWRGRMAISQKVPVVTWMAGIAWMLRDVPGLV
jgi:hypothetical protein